MADEASGSGVKSREEELARMMDELGLCEDDLNDVIFEALTTVVRTYVLL